MLDDIAEILAAAPAATYAVGMLSSPRTCFILLLLTASGLSAQQPYKLPLRGGHVIDPKNDIHKVMDVARSKQDAVSELMDSRAACVATPHHG